MSKPRISVCVPTYNGERWIAGTLRSILDQDEDLDVIVSDDCSSDRTVEIAGATGDTRVRVRRAPGRLGLAANWNRALGDARGIYVKLLMQDDELLPGALSVQASLLDRHPECGLAFGPRILEGDGSARAARWIATYGDPHVALGPVGEVLEGHKVVAKLTSRRLRANAIGEPSVVMLRRSTLEQTGLFNVHIRQLTDLDLWLRVAGVSELAFDTRPVARFRVHAESATARNRDAADGWLDRLWIIDGVARRETGPATITPRHYVAALLAGTREMAIALARRRRTVGATVEDLRTFFRRTTPR